MIALSMLMMKHTEHIKIYCKQGDVIISIVGTTGLVSIIDISLDKANLTENCVKLIDIKGAINDYIYYYLTSLQDRMKLKRNCWINTT